MTEYKRFKLDNFDSTREMLELLDTQRLIISDMEKENERLKQEKKKIIDIINNKITQLGMDWYRAEDNSKEEKEANLQLNILEELRDEIKRNIEFN